MLASVLLLPAFLTTSLPLACVLLFFGSLCLTTPVAPTEALVSDVVPPQLRGRASAIRSIVRAVSALSPLLVGILADTFAVTIEQCELFLRIGPASIRSTPYPFGALGSVAGR